MGLPFLPKLCEVMQITESRTTPERFGNLVKSMDAMGARGNLVRKGSMETPVRVDDPMKLLLVLQQRL